MNSDKIENLKKMQISKNFLNELLKTGTLLLAFSFIYMASPLRIHVLHSMGIRHIHLQAEYLERETMFFFMLAVINLLFIHGMWKKMRVSWYIEFAVVAVDLLHKFIAPVPHGYPGFFIFISIIYDAVLIALFVLLKNEYTRKNLGITLKNSLQTLLILILVVILESVLYVRMSRINLNHQPGVWETLSKSISILFGDSDNIVTNTKHGFLYRYQKNLWIQNFIVLFFGFANVLKPILGRHRVDTYEKARELVLEYGENPLAYLTLEKDKKLFFASGRDAVCSYNIVRGVFVICGDIICDDTDAPYFLDELIEYCSEEGLSMLLINVTSRFLELYRARGMQVSKFGEDACFDLNTYNLKGNKMAKLRAAVNHANAAGVTVEEYRPLIKRELDIERSLNEISESWFINKGGLKMYFTVGSASFENPLDRRYFYSRQGESILGFVVFIPYNNQKAYLADITRRKDGAPQGTIEKIVFDAFMKMRDEGAITGNMGLSPLYNIGGEDSDSTEKLLSKAYDKLNNFYNFQSLHHSKEKFAPSYWENRFLVYSKKTNLLKMISALIRVQYPQKITEFIFKKSNKKEKREIWVDELPINYKVSGNGDAFVMLHGNMSDLGYFEEQINYFSPDYKVYAIDTRGHGKSPLGARALSINNLATDLEKVIEKAGIKSCIMLGFSDGANIALKYASRSKNKLTALIIVSGNTKRTGLRKRFILYYTAVHYATKLIGFFSRKFRRLSSKLKLAYADPGISKAELAKINIPVLVMAGEHDAVAQNHIKELAESIPGATLSVISSAGHNLLRENAEECNRIIRNFLSKIEK